MPVALLGIVQLCALCMRTYFICTPHVQHMYIRMFNVCTAYVQRMYPYASVHVYVCGHNKRRLAEESAVQQQMFNHQAQQSAVDFSYMPENPDTSNSDQETSRDMVEHMLGYFQTAC